MPFKLVSDYAPTGDQPDAIEQLVQGLTDEVPFQTLLGVTGSGKTFTIANVIERVQRPTLVLSHNKTLAAQLYGEFRQFFPENAVEYFVSYYDYYQPEAYIPSTNTYIEKDLSINDEVEKLRLSASSTLLSGRRDVIVVSSVSCIYGIGNPDDFNANIIRIRQGEVISRNSLLHRLVAGLYSRTQADFNRGNFRVQGDTVDVFPAYADLAYRIIFWGDTIETMESFDPANGKKIGNFHELAIYPANIFVTSKDRMQQAIHDIQDDMMRQVAFFRDHGKELEAKRLEDRVNYDLEMIRELGYCPGIENYSRYFDGRRPGSRPFCLMDYFPSDFLLVVDESHVTIPQVHGMYGGDFSRKQNLVEYGFRLPAALDNRPLKFGEFEALINQAVFVSATPADYEISRSEGVVVEQLIRPTGLLEPEIIVKPSLNQIDDLLEEIHLRKDNDERVLVTTLTKRMAEELTKYLGQSGINCRYIHSDVDTMERVEILRELRLGSFDVLVGVNLLREGLDLPEVSLVAILDADKEGFLRSARSLIQTAGRAARNLNARVIMYADKITRSMQTAIEETDRKREKQLRYNAENNITPAQIRKTVEAIHKQASVAGQHEMAASAYLEKDQVDLAADPVIRVMSKEQMQKAIIRIRKDMSRAAKELDFLEAARLRDELYALENYFRKRYL
jgi:excinuclease ABC subunit B